VHPADEVTSMQVRLGSRRTSHLRHWHKYTAGFGIEPRSVHEFERPSANPEDDVVRPHLVAPCNWWRPAARRVRRR
jgi:hypothetical protein